MKVLELFSGTQSISKEKMNTLRNAVIRLLIQGWTEREIILEIRKITARYALDKFK